LNGGDALPAADPLRSLRPPRHLVMLRAVHPLEAKLALLAIVLITVLIGALAILTGRMGSAFDGRPLLAAAIAGAALGALGSWVIAQRLAGALRARERALTHAAFHDAETGLPNRIGLERRLPHLGGDQPVFVAVFGVERYAQMRAVLGNDHCARMQRRLATALAAHQPNWLLARPAPDLVAAAFPAADLTEAKRLAGKAADRMQAVDLGVGAQGAVDIRTVTGLSTGAIQPSSALLTEAELALDAARARRSRAAVFDPVASARAADTLALMAALRDAIAKGDLWLAHQPKLDLRTGRISGVECLVRWTDPVRGPVPPDRFIALAEETGDIRTLTEWVLSRAVEDQATIAAAGRELTMSVNLSGRLVGDASVTRLVLAAAARAKGKLCLEVTETAVMARPDGALAQFRKMRDHGVAVAIDDYGSGLSSLAYLKKIEADELKIDKSLITALPRSPRDAILVRSTVDLAHSLGMTATAEGVEDASARDLLAVLGCDHVQGWQVGRPMPLADLLTHLPRLEQTNAAA
jgi:EAL domain-containing protein (putative c-di-GMP-specific phosphodiesterase class I)/GGDEF domain-containing protein